jgi:hypothetical protein
MIALCCGTAAMGAAVLNTIHRCQSVAANQAQTQHQQGVQQGDVQSVQVEPMCCST